MKEYFVFVAYNPIGQDDYINEGETRTSSGIVKANHAHKAASIFMSKTEITNDQVESINVSRIWNN